MCRGLVRGYHTINVCEQAKSPYYKYILIVCDKSELETSPKERGVVYFG